MYKFIVGTIILGAIAIGSSVIINVNANGTAPTSLEPTETEVNIEIIDMVGDTLRYAPYIGDIEGYDEIEATEEEIELTDEPEAEYMVNGNVSAEDVEYDQDEIENTTPSAGYDSSSGSGNNHTTTNQSQSITNTTTNATTSNTGTSNTTQPVVTPSVSTTEEVTTEEELEAVWVVDQEEQVNTYPVYETVYHNVCNECHAIIDYVELEHMQGPCSSWSGDVPFTVQTGTYTEVIPEQGHWEYR